MKRALIRSSTFVRAAKRLLKKQPQLGNELEATLTLLADDAFHASLKTHKLHGDLSGFWSCSVGYDFRIIFNFVQLEGHEAILLRSIGSHDEVY